MKIPDVAPLHPGYHSAMSAASPVQSIGSLRWHALSFGRDKRLSRYPAGIEVLP
jgi:hypothetical protein